MSSSNRPTPRVAIIGASGIGKNHAAWFAGNGCEVVAFVGTSPASVAATAEVLQQRLGSAPSGYTDVAQMLQSEELDIVCVSSPPHLHFEHAQLCIEKGVHTLCEKPLVYDPQLESQQLRSQAQQLVQQAKDRGVLLGTQMQYPFIAEKLCGLAGVDSGDIRTFAMEMETKNLKAGRTHETIWIELAPHPLSVLQRVAEDARLDEGSIQCKIGEQETVACFDLLRRDGSTIDATLITRCDPSTSAPLRRFTINGCPIDYAGRKNTSGEFLTYLSSGDEEIVMPDLVDILIGNFVAATRKKQPLFVSGADGAKNLDWLLQILDHGKRV